MKEITLAILVMAVSGCSTIGQALYDWQTEYPDNVIEETLENFLDNVVDIDIDLTPISGDEKQKLN